MDEFLKAVQEEADQVARDLRKLVDELEPLNEERQRLEERARALDTVIASYKVRQINSGSFRRPGSERHFLEVAFDILQKEGPLYYNILLDRIREQGVTVPGRNPGANLIAHMSRDQRFERIGRGTYALAQPSPAT